MNQPKVLSPLRRDAWNREAGLERRNEVFRQFGGVCKRCGFSDERALQVDHIDGGGCKELRRTGNKRHYYKHVLLNIARYQLLCANCNWIKRHEQGEHSGSYSVAK